MNKELYDSFVEFYQGLPKDRGSESPPRGTMSACLVVLDLLMDTFRLDREYFVTSGQPGSGGQIRLLTQTHLRNILSGFGEVRQLSKVGGRTNRGNIGFLDGYFLPFAKSWGIAHLGQDSRREVLSECQRYVVARIAELHEREHIQMVYYPEMTTVSNISSLLARAKESQKDGVVAQHLVGAKLVCRYPHLQISNESASAADDQTGRPGDFHVNDTAFHVTVAPGEGVYTRCLDNLREGYRVYLLVPDSRVEKTRKAIDGVAKGRVTTDGIESFIARNIDEMGEYDNNDLRITMRKLIDAYNQRVVEAETDQSLQIDAPANLPLRNNSTD